jgi:hypothetical protein
MVRGSRFVLPIVVAWGLPPVARVVMADDTAQRPRMLQFDQAAPERRPPSQRRLVDARAIVERRFREPLGHTDSAAGATAAAAVLLDAAATERDTAVKWLLLTEARRLAAAAGNAVAVDRAITMADAAYDFDAIAEEQRTLREIPLQALDPDRAAALARIAEGLAQRAEADDRDEVAVDAWALAMRAWQRAGDMAAARRAAEMCDAGGKPAARILH